MFTRMETKAEFTVVGVEGSPVNGDETAVHRLVENFAEHRRDEVKHPVHARVDLGIAMKHTPEEFVFFWGREVSQVEDVPAGMVVHTLRAQEYAVFTHKGDVNRLREIFGYIFGTWLPESEYERVDAPFFELHDERAIWKGPNVEQSEVDVYIPVRRKQ